MMRKLVLVLLLICLRFTQGQWTLETERASPSYDSFKNYSELNYPGSRTFHFMTTDHNGLVWLGNGLFNANNSFCDLWKYDPSTQQFAWMLGAPTIISNSDTDFDFDMPLMRGLSNIWNDREGNMWLYGGCWGNPTQAASKMLADLWMLNLTDSNNPQWNWISGVDRTKQLNNPVNRKTIYGPIGMFLPFEESHPGPVADAITWQDDNYNFYMFGGIGPDSINPMLSDLWIYNYTVAKWAFMGNFTTNAINNNGYGTLGVPSPNNWPTARHGGSSWIRNDVVYMYGGHTLVIAYYNDYWTWNNTMWTWIGGSSVTQSSDSTHGDYGYWSTDNYPMGAANSAAWIDDSHLWLYGGSGVYKSFQELWVYDTTLGKWAWLGPLSNETQVPPSRYGAGRALVNDTLIIYGGYTTVNATDRVLSDMWKLNYSHFVVTEKTAELLQSSEVAMTTVNKSGVIAVAIVIPIIAVIALALIIFFLYRKKSRKSQIHEIPLESRKTRVKWEGAAVQGVEIGSLIGIGSFGEVYQGSWNKTAVALKKLKPEYYEYFKKEVDTIMKLNHPQIVQYLGVYLESKDCFIVMELMNAGNLHNLFQSSIQFSDSELLTMASDAAQGLSYLHSNGIIHRDCSLRNLLASTVVGQNRRYTIKISDFGMATALEETYYKSESKILPYKWASPEVLKFGKYSLSSDVWAFAVTLWELFSLGALPYAGKSNVETSEFVLAGNRLSKPERCSDSLYQLMLRCWNETSKDRPTIVEVYNTLQDLLYSGNVPVIEIPVEQPRNNEISRLIYNN